MIRDNIKLICKAKGMQLGDISDALKITRQTLHTYLTGRPTLETIERIAAVLGVPSFVILHPAPLTALRLEAERLQDNPPTICPYCKKRIKVQLTQDEQPEE